MVAMLSHGDFLFVVRDSVVVSATTQTIQVEVYNVENFALVRCLTFPMTANDHPDPYSPVSMASWRKDNFIVIGAGATIYRIDTGGKVDTLCTVGSLIVAMVNRDDNLLVLTSSKSFESLYGSSAVTLRRYTKRGQPISDRVIKLTLSGTWNHVLLMPDGQFVISASDYHRSSHSVTWFDQNGVVIMTCGSTQSVGMKFIDRPKQVACDMKTGRIIVADCLNGRIVIIDPTKRMMHQLPVDDDVELQDPFALCFDESRDRLYVGESIGGFTNLTHDSDMDGHAPRLLVFDNLRPN